MVVLGAIEGGTKKGGGKGGIGGDEEGRGGCAQRHSVSLCTMLCWVRWLSKRDSSQLYDEFESGCIYSYGSAGPCQSVCSAGGGVCLLAGQWQSIFGVESKGERVCTASGWG